MSLDPVSLISEMAGAIPEVGAAISKIVDWLREHHPALDLSPLGAGADAMDAARAAALRRTTE